MKVNFKDKQDFKKIKKISLIKYDFVIIGSGPAAVTLLNKLTLREGNNPKILIIEEGDYFKKRHKKVLSKHIKIKLKSRAFTVGGTSSIWSNVSSYFEEFEMQSRWKNKQLNLWPLQHKLLLQEYTQINKKYKFSLNKLKKRNFNIPFEVRPFIGSVKPINFKKFIRTEKKFKDLEHLKKQIGSGKR